MGSVATKDAEPYAVAAGIRARFARKRFDDELIGLSQRLKWRDKPAEEIPSLIPILADSNLPRVKESIRSAL